MATGEPNNLDLSYADTLWKAADALRGPVDAAEYKHVVLGLHFLKFITTVSSPAAMNCNPPFNVSDYSAPLLRGDKRWTFGDPPVGNANFEWVQHFIHHLSPSGFAGSVLANGSMGSN